jgi:hypothetical protein
VSGVEDDDVSSLVLWYAGVVASSSSSLSFTLFALTDQLLDQKYRSYEINRAIVVLQSTDIDLLFFQVRASSELIQ